MKRGYIYLVLAALSYGSMGVLIRALSVSLGPFWQTFLRLVVSFVLTLGLVLVAKKPLMLKTRKDYVLMPLMGVVGYGLQIVLFTLSIYHNTIGNALFVFSCYPILAAVLAHFFLGERLNKRIIVSLVLLFSVLFLLFDPGNLTGHLLGNVYALSACMTFAIYIICSRILSGRGNAPETITMWSVGLAALSSGLVAGGFEKLPSGAFDAKALLYLVLFGFLNAAAFNLVNKGFATVKASTGTMILLLEPVIGSFLGLVLFHEIPTMTFLVGAVVMITSIYIATFKLD